MSIVSVLAEDKRLVTYRPRLNEITGSVTATVLLQQIIFHADSVGYRPFYKFRAPCEHKLYRENDSWIEELGFSPAEFDTARNKIATRVKKGDSKADALKGETANHLVIYWTDASRVTWYLLNVDLLKRILDKLYADSRNSNYQKSGDSPNSESQDSESTRKLGNQELPLPETTSEIPTEDTKKTQADPLSFELERETASIQQAGANYAVPAPAGGAFSLGDRLITAACARLGRSEPEGEKRQQALAFFEKALKAENLLGDDGVLTVQAVRDWLDPEGAYAFYLPQYALTCKHELALRHFGIVLSRAKASYRKQGDRRARLVEANAEVLAAVPARLPEPVPKDDVIGARVKGVLRDQVGRNEFKQYVQPCQFTCDDGTLRVTAPDEFTRDWVENRLGLSIGRVVKALAGGLVVEYEVET